MSASDAPVIETPSPALLSPAPISEIVTTPSPTGAEDGDPFCTGRRRRKQVSAQEELAAAMLRRLEADEEEGAGVRIREAEAQKRAEDREQRIVDIMEGLVNMLRGPQWSDFIE